ncbi:MAG TPA: MerR family transcriptional regulator [Rhizomicrobium sp.]|jgi:DNA-binding transcriptional MerR regulator|nr:MerR family transcriptional regulator [Rhizomicrobium sp.]
MPAAAAAQSMKSPEAFRTISEVASELDVPQHVLRFWETKFTQVRPVKRAGGRRYYRPDDIDLLRGIRALLYSDGYTIKGVQKLLREQGAKYVTELGRTEPPARSRGRSRNGANGGEPPGERAAVLPIRQAREESRPAEESRLGEPDRVKLELLLAELLQMKARLRAARERLRL